MAKLYASEVGVWVADRALQIFGGYGYVKDFPVGEVLPRHEALHDRRGDERDPAHGHRSRGASSGLSEAARGSRRAHRIAGSRGRWRARSASSRRTPAGAAPVLRAAFPPRRRAPRCSGSRALPARGSPASSTGSSPRTARDGPRVGVVAVDPIERVLRRRDPRATASGCRGTRPTPGSSSAPWRAAATSAGSRARRTTRVDLLDAAGLRPDHRRDGRRRPGRDRRRPRGRRRAGRARARAWGTTSRRSRPGSSRSRTSS